MTGKILPKTKHKIQFIVDEENRIIGGVRDDIYFSLADIFHNPHLHQLMHEFEREMKK